MKSILKVLTAIVLIFSPLSAFATIALDNIVYDNSGSNFSYTTTGTNMFMVVCERHTGAGAFSSFTYNGVSLTRLNEVQIGTSGNYLSYFYLNAPATGSHTFVNNTNNFVGLSVATYSGVKQTGQPKSNTGGGGQSIGANPNISLTVATQGSWATVCLESDNGTPSSVSNWTRKGSSQSNVIFGDSNAGLSPGPITFGGTYGSGSANNAISAMELEDATPPVTASAPPQELLVFN